MVTTISDLPQLCIQKKAHLPTVSGIYFVLEEETVLYIGIATNLRERWVQHHRYEELVNKHPTAKIYFQQLEEKSLKDKEAAMINVFKPIYNKVLLNEETKSVASKKVTLKAPTVRLVEMEAKRLNLPPFPNALDYIITDYVAKKNHEYENLIEEATKPNFTIHDIDIDNSEYLESKDTPKNKNKYTAFR